MDRSAEALRKDVRRGPGDRRATSARLARATVGVGDANAEPRKGWRGQSITSRPTRIIEGRAAHLRRPRPSACGVCELRARGNHRCARARGRGRRNARRRSGRGFPGSTGACAVCQEEGLRHGPQTPPTPPRWEERASGPASMTATSGGPGSVCGPNAGEWRRRGCWRWRNLPSARCGVVRSGRKEGQSPKPRAATEPDTAKRGRTAAEAAEGEGLAPPARDARSNTTG